MTAMESARGLDPEPMIEDRPLERRRCFWLGLAVMWAYALVFLMYGLVDVLAVPASERVNNGSRGTFFAVHLNPYWEFSEDFHLYAVRAKRVRDRGWTDSPLYAPPGEVEEKADYTAPLQVLLMRLAVLTDGRPLPYALFMTSVVGVAWTVLYLAASRWKHPSVSPLAIPIALTFTLLFESIGGLFHPNGEFGQWPVHRGLRMASLAWTSPLLLAEAIAAASLMVRPARGAGRVLFIGVVIGVLALADVWGFLMGGGIAVVLAALLVLRLVWQAWTGGALRASLVGASTGVILAGLSGLGIFAATTGDLDPDVLVRAGLGPAWAESPWGLGNSKWTSHTTQFQMKVLAGVFAVLCLYGTLTLGREPRSATMSWRLRWPTERRAFLGVLAAIAAAAPIVVGAALARFGVEMYHVYQLEWRADLITLFGLTLALTECAKLAIRYFCRIFEVRCFRWELTGALASLALLFVYHSARTYEFVARMGAREFFLTDDEEHLKNWLRRREPFVGRETLATASHELNYLCAYWTNADLLLPEGFPYHNRESNDAIEERMARLLALYNATPSRWQEFNLYRHGWDQWSWATSRLLSARQGYMYYLQHRGIGVDASLATKPHSSQPKYTTAHMAEERLVSDMHAAEGNHLIHRAALDAVQRIAGLLEQRPTLAENERPDVIVVDEVSRFLGTPDFTGYRREFQHGSLEAWVLQKRDGREEEQLARRSGEEGASDQPHATGAAHRTDVARGRASGAID